MTSAGRAVARLADRHAMWIPVWTAVFVRLAMLGSLPLLILPDSCLSPDRQGYLVWARQILEDGNFAGNPARTPGYPMLLASAFALFGTSGVTVLILQHLQGLLAVVLVTLMAKKIAGPRVAAATGVLAALDPWQLLFAHAALTESSMIAVVVVAAAIVVLPESRSPRWGFCLGAVCGAMCLIRPTGMALVPFFALAHFSSGSWALAPLARSASAIALGLILSVGPWLGFNYSRGVQGLAVADEAILLQSTALHGLLDKECAPDDVPFMIRLGFATTIGQSNSERATEEFRALCRQGGLTRDQGADWSRCSIRTNPLGYLRAVWDTLRWQLNVGLPERPRANDEMAFLARQLTNDRKKKANEKASNYVNVRDGLKGRTFAMRAGQKGSLAGRFFEPVGSGDLRGLPQVPLAILACAALCMAAVRRRGTEFFLMAGSVAFVMAHAVILFPWSRYSLPSEMLWYLSLPILGVTLFPALCTPGGSTVVERESLESR